MGSDRHDEQRPGLVVEVEVTPVKRDLKYWGDVAVGTISAALGASVGDVGEPFIASEGSPPRDASSRLVLQDLDGTVLFTSQWFDDAAALQREHERWANLVASKSQDQVLNALRDRL